MDFQIMSLSSSKQPDFGRFEFKSIRDAGLGGGSMVEQAGDGVMVGPRSVGHELPSR